MEIKDLKFEVQVKIQKPLSEVFDAVYNPKKLVNYFTTAVASDTLDTGKTVLWGFADFAEGKPFPVKVEKCVKDELIVLSWPAHETENAYDHDTKKDVEYKTQTEFKFEKVNDGETIMKISEGGWRPTQEALNGSYMNCQGWMNFGCCLKAWIEYGIQLRKGFF